MKLLDTIKASIIEIINIVRDILKRFEGKLKYNLIVQFIEVVNEN